MARKERSSDTVFSRLRQVGEEAVNTILDELKINRSLRNRVERAGEQLKANKALLDKNIEFLLDLMNLPSKREVRELRERVDRLTGQIVNLNLKLDRLLAQREKTRAAGRKISKATSN